MNFDPDEGVTLYGIGRTTLRRAVEQVMALPHPERGEATIFRDEEPSILDIAEIEQLAAEWGIGSQ